MRRTGSFIRCAAKPDVAKGPLQRGQEHESFERVSWDEALDAIAARLKQISDRYGPESILPYSYAGTIGVLGYGSMDRRFFHRLGASQLDRTICSEAGGQAWNLVYGKKFGTPTEDLRLAKLILAWGANIHGNNIHLWPFVEEARRNGARLIVIDPYRTRTAAVADWHIAIRPGTDAALALGMMHVILNEGLEDRAYIAEMTHGFERLAERAREYTPERVAAWTGMTAAEIEQLAREYATTRPAHAAPELRRAAKRERRHGRARHRHAACAHRRVEASRRRRTAFDFGRVSVGQEGSRAARSGAGLAVRPACARGEHVGAWPRAHGAQARTRRKTARRGARAVCLQLESRRGGAESQRGAAAD